MKRTPRSTAPIDILRIAAAVARPGIDTRIWCSLGYALQDARLDATHGWLVDVQLLPSGLETTARIPQPNAGGGFGASEGPILKDDEVAIVFPDGDPAAGGIILARFWSASDKPPDLAVQNAADIVRVLKKDTSYRVKLTGSGIIRMEAEGKAYYAGSTVTLESGNVRLGGEDATEQYVMGTTFRADLTTLDNAASAALSALGPALAAAGGSLVTAGANPAFAAAFPEAATALGAAGGSLATAGGSVAGWVAALTAFEAKVLAHLSTVTKGK